MSGSYSRLYHRFSVEFPDIYSDDRALATWIRLLLLADASWPMRPPLPRSVKERQLQHLASAGLVEVVGDDQYTIRGLDAERTRRRDAAAVGAAKRWHSGGNASGVPSRDETNRSRDEKEIPPPPAERGRRANGTNLRATCTSPRQSGTDLRSNGVSPRQRLRKAKRAPAGPSVAQILRAANEGRPADA